MSGEARDDLWNAFSEMRPRAIERNRVQRCTLTFEDGPTPLLVCAVVTPEEEPARLTSALQELIAERLAEHGPQRVLGIARSADSDRVYDALVLFDKTWRGSAVGPRFSPLRLVADPREPLGAREVRRGSVSTSFVESSRFRFVSQRDGNSGLSRR